MMCSSEGSGVCYVETKNLDGETNLKHKVTEKFINYKMQQVIGDSEKMEHNMKGVLVCE